MCILEVPGTGGVKTVDREDVAGHQRSPGHGTVGAVRDLEAMWTP